MAITTVAGLIGWDAAASVTGRAPRTVQHWSESENRGTPTLEQAIALDRAYIAAGGGYAPISDSFARQMEVVMADADACRVALAEDVALFARETGDAVGRCIQALAPGASPALIQAAILETEEADAIVPRLLGRLKALQPGNGVGREGNGVTK
jgi:hypothetical protein